MPDISLNAAGNRLLPALPVNEAAVLRSHLDKVKLTVRENLYENNGAIEYVHFINCGVVSMTTTLGGDEYPVEIATIGPEGIVGIPVFLGAETMPSNAFVQVAGDSLRIRSSAFRQIIKECPALTRLLLRYTMALMNQIGQTAACNRVHAVEERCARWLLMTHDRVFSSEFSLTQEFLGQMLGVRRPTVSIAAGILAKAGLISYVRGHIRILNRPGLEAASCSCYRIIADDFERLVGHEG